MLKEKMQDAMNLQIKWEMYSAHLYVSMSAYFMSYNLLGFANWMRVQAQEELFHAMKFFDFINERGGRVILQDIPAPPTQWTSPLDVFEAALKHEEDVTEKINVLRDARGHRRPDVPRPMRSDSPGSCLSKHCHRQSPAAAETSVGRGFPGTPECPAIRSS